jgi:hypothetical protein
MEMLITKKLKIKWNGATIKWYESKGYTYTNANDEFEIKTQDLPNGSEFKVSVICDNPCCKNKNEFLITWKYYVKRIDNNGKFYCKVCNKVNFKRENSNKNKQSISFEQWCIENNRRDVLDRWNYELNNKLPSEVSYSAHSKYYFKCPRELHESELISLNCTIHNNGNLNCKCKKCNSFAQWGIDNLGDDFLEKYWDYEKNKGIDPWEISKSSHKLFYIYCQENKLHNSYLINGNKFTNNRRCPFCNSFASHRVHKLDSLGTLYPQTINIWSDKNKKPTLNYSPSSHEKVWWKCDCGKHEEYYRSIKDSYDSDFRCPECSQERTESFLQEKVRLYLEALNYGKYTILHENKCTIVPQNPKKLGTNNALPFDNEIKELKLIIEVHGIQHYKIGGFHEKSAKHNRRSLEQEFHYQQVKDRYKRIYSKSQGYDYLEIPYWTDDKDETWKKLIDDKINEILHNKKLNMAS